MFPVLLSILLPDDEGSSDQVTTKGDPVASTNSSIKSFCNETFLRREKEKKRKKNVLPFDIKCYEMLTFLP
jgi:hypothetical protein